MPLMLHNFLLYKIGSFVHTQDKEIRRNGISLSYSSLGHEILTASIVLVNIDVTLVTECMIMLAITMGILISNDTYDMKFQ